MYQLSRFCLPFYSGLNGGPQKIRPHPNPQPVVNIVSNGKRVYYIANGVIKLRILREGAYSELSRWTRNAITCILVRKRQRKS